MLLQCLHWLRAQLDSFCPTSRDTFGQIELEL